MTEPDNDNLADIDPLITEAVLAHADVFIEADKRVDDIVAWGEAQLKTREDEIRNSNGSLTEFKNAAKDVEQMVAEKLRALENEVRERAAASAPSGLST